MLVNKRPMGGPSCLVTDSSAASKLDLQWQNSNIHSDIQTGPHPGLSTQSALSP